MIVSTATLEARLDEWADWLMRCANHGLGFANRTTEARLMDEGGTLISGTGPYYPPTDPRAEEIEALVKELHHHNPRLSRALRVYYLDTDALKYRARRLGVSLSQFKRHIDMAKSWLAGRLSTTQ